MIQLGLDSLDSVVIPMPKWASENDRLVSVERFKLYPPEV